MSQVPYRLRYAALLFLIEKNLLPWRKFFPLRVNSILKGFNCCPGKLIRSHKSSLLLKLENVFVKHYAPNHMPDPKGEWSFKEYNSELHYGIYLKVYQFIYTLACNYMPIMRILAKEVLQISHSKGCSYTKCLCPKKESNATENLRKWFKS